MTRKVVVLRTEDEQADGVLPYQPLDKDTIYFFPEVSGKVITGSGLRKALRVYALDRNFQPAYPHPFRFIKLCPGDTVSLFPHVRHVVETAWNAPVISSFQFLRKYLYAD